MEEQKIKAFLDAHDYDIRKTGNARWIDQKCTMDVVCLVADCILEYIDNSKSETFTVTQIWYNKYTVDNVKDIFSKPDPSSKASNEYDKYFGQPIKLLDAAGIIHGERQGSRYIYRIVDRELLEYISFRERNCFTFLCLYIEKVLRDSGIYYLFQNFFESQDADAYMRMKEGFADYTIRHTPINGRTECGRIFTKILNPLAYKHKKLGTEDGHVSSHIITYDMLMYNQRNWRDIYSSKPKDQTRREHESAEISQSTISPIASYEINKAKKNLRKFNDRYRNGRSEVYDSNHVHDHATQMHHIFPASAYPDIAGLIENLIALTPSQHNLYAHPENHTQYIDKDYQYCCLVAKTGSIRDNILGDVGDYQIYDFWLYQFVLSTGLSNEDFFRISTNDFDAILQKIEEHY